MSVCILPRLHRQYMGTPRPLHVTRLRALTEGPDPKMVRVGIRSKGCSGKQYHLEYTNTKEKFDEQANQDGTSTHPQTKSAMQTCSGLLDGRESRP